ncbi:hypothetical protein [Rhodococcoides fascians]|uniref:hypothetical protein n=1 Tax=Rhodococcoides fascians TaxID=1828 RepID=UPI00379BA027
MSENRFAKVEGIEELVGELIGAGSMMWEHVELAGVFESTEAAKLMREGIERLSQILGEGSPAASSNKIVGGPGDGAVILREYTLRITSHGVEVTSEDEDDFASDVEFAKAASMDMAVAVAVFLRGAGQPDLASEQLTFATQLKETLE